MALTAGVGGAVKKPCARPVRGTVAHGRSDRLAQLRAFCQVARLGNVTRAAEYIRSSQPAVSHKVRKLEEALGVSLFVRHGPRISLTRAGRALYARAMPLVEGIDRLPDAFAERHHGVADDALTVGAGQTSASYLLPRYVERFRLRWPGVRIEIRTGTGEQRLAWLRGYELDLVVGAMDVAPGDLEFHPMLASEFVLITASDHALAGRASVGIEEAAAYPLVGHGPARYVGQVAEIMLRHHGVAPEIVVEVDGWGAITNYVAAGVGVAVVPELCLTEHDGLWRIPFADVLRPRRYGAITRRDGMLGLNARRFLETMAGPAPGAP